MQQESITQSSRSPGAAFQQKSAALSLLIIGGATIYYLSKVWPLRSVVISGENLPPGYGSLIVTTVLLIVVAEIVLQAVLAISEPGAASTTHREEHGVLKATRNAYWVLSSGMMATIVSILLPNAPLFWTANIAILTLLLAEMVNFASRLLYAHRSVTSSQ